MSPDQRLSRDGSELLFWWRCTSCERAHRNCTFFLVDGKGSYPRHPSPDFKNPQGHEYPVLEPAGWKIHILCPDCQEHSSLGNSDAYWFDAPMALRGDMGYLHWVRHLGEKTWCGYGDVMRLLGLWEDRATSMDPGGVAVVSP